MSDGQLKPNSIVGELFALSFVEGDQVELYVEDDGHYHYKCSFNKFWLHDLEKTVSLAKQFK